MYKCNFFQEKVDADKALCAGTELKLFENILDCHPAIDGKDMHNKLQEKNAMKKQPKDSRNLYLVKEGGMSIVVGKYLFDLIIVFQLFLLE